MHVSFCFTKCMWVPNFLHQKITLLPCYNISEWILLVDMTLVSKEPLWEQHEFSESWSTVMPRWMKSSVSFQSNYENKVVRVSDISRWLMVTKEHNQSNGYWEEDLTQLKQRCTGKEHRLWQQVWGMLKAFLLSFWREREATSACSDNKSTCIIMLENASPEFSSSATSTLVPIPLTK